MNCRERVPFLGSLWIVQWWYREKGTRTQGGRASGNPFEIGGKRRQTFLAFPHIKRVKKWPSESVSNSRFCGQNPFFVKKS